MMKDDKELSNEQAAAVVNAKNVLASKQEVLMTIGQIQAFDFINKLTTVGTLKALAKIKELKSYKGLTYTNEKEELTTVGTWEDFCKHLLDSSKSSIDEKLINLHSFGESFLAASHKLGLGARELRKLRQLPEEDQALIIDSEAIDTGDRDAIKDLIEDLTEKHSKEKAELEQKAHEATQLANARKKIAETNASMFEEQMKKNDMLEQNQKAPSANWAKVVHDINLECTKIAAVAIEQMDKLLAMNERIISEEVTPEHSQAAYEHMALVQVHVVDQLFVVANTLSIETRERFDMFINDARPMYSEDEVLALEQQVKNRG